MISVDTAVYSPQNDVARERCLRDPSDWPVVAANVVLSAAIWINDGGFLGTGVATWTTDTPQRWLDRQPADSLGG